jgi:hypothetical protein
MNNDPQVCALCGSDHNLTFHHLIPKSCHRNKWFRKHFDITEMRARGIDICRRCHSFIHKQFPEKMLGRELNTLDSLTANETVIAYMRWAKKQH